MKRRRGFGFVEIVIAAVVMGFCAVPILWLVSSSRVETSKAINYLRALELANETIEWASVIPFEDPSGNDLRRLMTGYSESLFNNRGLRTGSNPAWTQLPLANDPTYSNQYDTAFFYREVKVIDLPQPGLKGYVKKVTVTISWNEGKVPDNPSATPPKRMRKIELSCLLFNDHKIEY
ncbi:MAG: type II secretion system protein [Candidatus Ozemobacteraceae bacterium]